MTQKEQDIALLTERTRLARDLHDSVNQLLFSLSLTARAGQEITTEPEVKDTFQYIQDLSQEALREMRTFIKQLHPPSLENGLISSFINYAKVLDLHIHTKVSGIKPIDPQIEEALWRIGQEAMANCKKHSGQQDIFIEINTVEPNIILTISDKGTGFFYDKKFDMPTMGLRSMQSRAEEIGGKFQVTTKVGMGTFIQVTIPFVKEE
ncbi:sensor histidine kinase [Oceanobacillus sp. 1P07AA]|uniref:sensor histidine kinase n=1 Tax=Oceanobacillus sp. 1P07AA TaxID=3132293 RepID=UPI0039A5E123